jgi:hypothetical protein
MPRINPPATEERFKNERRETNDMTETPEGATGVPMKSTSPKMARSIDLND